MLLSFHLIKFPKIIKWEMSFSAQNEVNSYKNFCWWILKYFFRWDKNGIYAISIVCCSTHSTSICRLVFLGCSIINCFCPRTPLFSSKNSAPVSPEQSPVTEERLSRKRCQNKQSSKRYRQKIKNKEQALFDAVGDLNKVSFFYI